MPIKRDMENINADSEGANERDEKEPMHLLDLISYTTFAICILGSVIMAVIETPAWLMLIVPSWLLSIAIRQ